MRRLALLAVLAFAALPGTAAAATYCVLDSACEAAGGTTASDVQQALDLAQSNAGLDRVEVGTNPCPTCRFTGGSYFSGDPLQIVGAGRASTTISITSPVLALGSSSSVSVSDLTIHVPGGSARGLELTGARATRVDVVVEPAATGSTGVALSNGGGFRAGRVDLEAGATGIAASGGTTSVDSSLVRIAAASGTGLLVESPTSQDVTLNARHVTLAGTGASGQDGAAVNATAAGETASLNLRNAIVHGADRSLRRNASAGATAQIAADNSSYDPTRISSEGSGGIAGATVTTSSPGFVDEAGGDYRLSATSALIDAGEPGGLTGVEFPSDLAGNERLLNGDGDCVPRRDVGAYEFLAPAVFVSTTASPRQVATGQSVTFGGSTACDPQPDAVLSYGWSFADGWSASGPVVQRAFAAPGQQTGTLTVTSSAGRSGSAAVAVAVVSPAPAIASPAPAPFSRKRLRPPVLIAARVIRVSRSGVAPIRLECAGELRCRGRIVLTTARPVSAAAAKRIQRLGSARFSIPPGRTTRVAVRLSKPKLRLARKLRPLAARATVTDRDSAGRRRAVTRSIVLRAR